MMLKPSAAPPVNQSCSASATSSAVPQTMRWPRALATRWYSSRMVRFCSRARRVSSSARLRFWFEGGSSGSGPSSG